MWTPAEIRRLIAQLAGVGLSIGGVVLLYQGIQSTGRINITSTFLSGEVESASAGLILLFLGFFLIALPIFWDSRQAPETQLAASVPSGRHQWHVPDHFRPLVATGWLALLALGLVFGGEILTTKFNVGSGLVLAVAGLYVGLFAGIVGVFAVMEWASSRPRKLSQTPPQPPT